jgi:hypothetical protein
VVEFVGIEALVARAVRQTKATILHSGAIFS